MGETREARRANRSCRSFSILKRIVMGETAASVTAARVGVFQYPQADRDG